MLEGRPDPLRLAARLVDDVQADQPDRGDLGALLLLHGGQDAAVVEPGGGQLLGRAAQVRGPSAGADAFVVTPVPLSLVLGD